MKALCDSGKRDARGKRKIDECTAGTLKDFVKQGAVQQLHCGKCLLHHYLDLLMKRRVMNYRKFSCLK